MPTASEPISGPERRQIDREVISLLRENQKDNRQIISLLREVVLLLERTGPRDTGEMCCADTDFFLPIVRS